MHKFIKEITLALPSNFSSDKLRTMITLPEARCRYGAGVARGTIISVTKEQPHMISCFRISYPNFLIAVVLLITLPVAIIYAYARDVD